MAARVPGIAADDPPRPAKRAAEGSVLTHRGDEIVAATRFEAASSPKRRRKRPLIEPHQGN